MIANSSTGSALISPVAATQPISGGNAPAAPPMTMFCAVRALQPDGVDQHVEQDRDRQDRGREMIGGEVHQHDREDAKAHAEMERGLAAHPPGRKRPVGGALHLGVEVGLIPLVERPRRARAQRDAQHRGEAEHRMDRHRRGEQAAQAGEHHQAHHARLGQREQVAPSAGRAGAVTAGVMARTRAYRGVRRKRKAGAPVKARA